MITCESWFPIHFSAFFSLVGRPGQRELLRPLSPCTPLVIGTIAPPIFHASIGALAGTRGGLITFLRIALALKRGVLVAVFSGVMSCCFAFGLDAGAPIRALTSLAGLRF